MKITPIKTRPVVPPQDDIYQILDESLTDLKEKSIVVITSKIVAIHQGRTIPFSDNIERDELAKLEADLYLDRDVVPGEHILFTIKNNLMIASAGIDKSNATDYFILWPEDSYGFAKEARNYLADKFKLSELGVIVCDSHVFPMRRGTIGMSLGHFGFEPLKSYIGQPDIFGRTMMVSISNRVDPIAIAAVFVMGEGNEQTPIALVEDIDSIKFSTDESENGGNGMSLEIPMEEDLFAPMLSAVDWKKGQGGKK